MLNFKFHFGILVVIALLTGCDSNDEDTSQTIKDLKKCRQAISNLEYANKMRIKLNFNIFEYADILVGCDREDRGKLSMLKSRNDKLESKPVDNGDLKIPES